MFENCLSKFKSCFPFHRLTVTSTFPILINMLWWNSKTFLWIIVQFTFRKMFFIIKIYIFTISNLYILFCPIELHGQNVPLHSHEFSIISWNYFLTYPQLICCFFYTLIFSYLFILIILCWIDFSLLTLFTIFLFLYFFFFHLSGDINTDSHVDELGRERDCYLSNK